MAVLVLFFSLIYLRDTSSGKFWVLVIPSPESVVMDTDYEGEATVSTNLRTHNDLMCHKIM